MKEILERKIGIWGITSNAINITIGAGIFVLPVAVAEKLGSAGIFAYLVCGILVALIMLCFADIGSKITTSGGAYAYIETAFGKYTGFITTNLFLFGYSLMANAAVTNALLDTLSYFFPFFKTEYVRVISIIALYTFLATINILGLKEGITLVKINTIAKLIPLVVIALFGWTKIESGNLTSHVNFEGTELGEISLMLFFAFAGIETALNISGEIKNPSKTIPRAIFLSTLVILLLYMLIQFSTQGILGDSILNYKDAPLAEVANRMIGPAGAMMVIVGASFSMFGNLSGETLNNPRIIYAAALDGVIPPKALAKVHKKFKTPYVAVISYAVVGCLLSLVGEFRQLAVLSSASILLVYLGVVLATIKYRNRENLDGAFKLPGGIIIPFAGAVSIVWLLSNLSAEELTYSFIFIGIISIIYLLMRYFRKA